MEDLTFFSGVGALLMVAISIAWVLMPFAVFGIKKRLDIIIRLLRSSSPD